MNANKSSFVALALSAVVGIAAQARAARRACAGHRHRRLRREGRRAAAHAGDAADHRGDRRTDARRRHREHHARGHQERRFPRHHGLAEGRQARRERSARVRRGVARHRRRSLSVVDARQHDDQRRGGDHDQWRRHDAGHGAEGQRRPHDDGDVQGWPADRDGAARHAGDEGDGGGCVAPESRNARDRLRHAEERDHAGREPDLADAAAPAAK